MAAIVAGAIFMTHGIALSVQSRQPNNIDHAMYFLSDVRQAKECSMSVENGEIVIAENVSNPAMSCPDMFSWKLFADAVNDEFWSHWAADSETWPSEPYALCAEGSSAANCCSLNSADNPGYDGDIPSKHCPYYPGDHLDALEASRILRASAPSKAHAIFSMDDRGTGIEPETGRIIRQEMAELVFRNKPGFDYIFKNNLYNTEGVVDVFNANNQNLQDHAPYRATSQPGKLVTIDLPIQSVMIKSNWLHRDRAEALGLTDSPDAPYIKLNIPESEQFLDNQAEVFEPGEHWLVALHITSKDIPNWVWTTFEHVNNPGRCDHTGCNDSYGYRSADALPAANSADNYTSPKTQSDGLAVPAQIFDLGEMYIDGPMREELAQVFAGLGIGTQEQAGEMLSKSDRGWLSYRLKGSQVEFTDSYGRPTLLGNSVTEGGFVNSSSCITCHARANTGASGPIPNMVGVFENQLDDIGYSRSSYGTPKPHWFRRSAQPPALNALQTDFVWGFLNAKDIQEDES